MIYPIRLIHAGLAAVLITVGIPQAMAQLACGGSDGGTCAEGTTCYGGVCQATQPCSEDSSGNSCPQDRCWYPVGVANPSLTCTGVTPDDDDDINVPELNALMLPVTMGIAGAMLLITRRKLISRSKY